jgi:hypothetical protein
VHAVARAHVVAAILIPLFSTPPESAAAPGQVCLQPARDARVHVSLLADSDLVALVRWAKEQTCVEYEFESSLGSRRLAQSVILTVMGSDVGTTFELLLHSMNLRLAGKGARRTIVATGPEAAPSKAARDKEKADIERDKVFDHIESEITRKDDAHYVITRRGLEAALGNFSSLSRTLRLAPEVKDGRPNGFRILALKPGSFLARVGFLNGDIVVSINGIDLSGPDKAMEAYARVRTASDLRFSILRDGKPVALETKIE